VYINTRFGSSESIKPPYLLGRHWSKLNIIVMNIRRECFKFFGTVNVAAKKNLYILYIAIRSASRDFLKDHL